MRQNAGRRRLRRCANRLFSVVPLYSRPVAVCTEKLISLALQLDAELGQQRQEVGVGAVVADDEAGVDRDRWPSCSISCVCVWPPT